MIVAPNERSAYLDNRGMGPYPPESSLTLHAYALLTQELSFAIRGNGVIAYGEFQMLVRRWVEVRHTGGRAEPVRVEVHGGHIAVLVRAGDSIASVASWEP